MKYMNRSSVDYLLEKDHFSNHRDENLQALGGSAFLISSKSLSYPTSTQKFLTLNFL